jgi:Na(+)-translocating NADH:ubiquinone oxidoreductase C subunit
MKPVVFMVVISVVFVGALATINELTRAQVENNLKIQEAKEILYAFDIFPANFEPASLSSKATTLTIPWPKEEVLEIFNARLKKVEIPITDKLRQLTQGTFLDGQTNITIFEHITAQNETIAYGLMLSGKGLWGTIQGFGVVTADLEKMQGIAFLKQSETPGLGARIIEEEYKRYFRNLDLGKFAAANVAGTPIIMVKKKLQTNIIASTNSVQAITGATQTSQGVLDMVNSNLRVYLPILQAYKGQQL